MESNDNGLHVNSNSESIENRVDMVPNEKANRTEGLPKNFTEPPPAPVVDSQEAKHWAFYRAILAEFVATSLFLYVTLTALIGSAATSTHSATLETAWAFGGIIFVLVYCIAGISGGHINPAVTWGLFIARKVTLVAYTVAQCVGAMVGAGIAKGVHGKEEFHAFGSEAENGVQPAHTVAQALAAEIMGTFVLLFTVLCSADPSSKVLVPLPIGLAVFVVHLATIPITGTGINPARSLGAAIANPSHGRWSQHWIFWVGPLTGAVCAAVYHICIESSHSSLEDSTNEN